MIVVMKVNEFLESYYVYAYVMRLYGVCDLTSYSGVFTNITHIILSSGNKQCSNTYCHAA